jgi:hypothetical protein
MTLSKHPSNPLGRASITIKCQVLGVAMKFPELFLLCNSKGAVWPDHSRDMSECFTDCGTDKACVSISCLRNK